MSGPTPAPEPQEDPALDHGVLGSGPLLEIGGWHAAARNGGQALLHWRSAWLAARAAGVASPEPQEAIAPASHAQALVRIQRSRGGTEADLAEALGAVAAGGTIAVAGPNRLGIAAWIARLTTLLGGPLRTHARAKARVAVFARGAAPAPPRSGPALAADGGAGIPGGLAIATLPGVFGAAGTDAGTALLAAHLLGRSPAARVLDLGCGAGTLAICALNAWPEARALLLDADARAVASASANLERLGLASRARVLWWDASERVPEDGFDLAVVNPPAHHGDAVDLGAAQAMLRALPDALAEGGCALVVANRRLPYERALARVGPCRLAQERDGYKIIEARRSGRRDDGGSA